MRLSTLEMLSTASPVRREYTDNFDDTLTNAVNRDVGQVANDELSSVRFRPRGLGAETY